MPATKFFIPHTQKKLARNAQALRFSPSEALIVELILAQNWDWIPGIQGAWLLFESPDFQVLAFTEAGIPGGKIGINSAGLGLCVNGVFLPWDRWDGEGLPFHARAWMVLQSHSLAEAQEIIRSGSSPCPEIFSLDKKMKRFPSSARPHQTCVLTPNHGVLAHANPLRSS